ncbi:MBL fold metallo-hydrolase [Streptomyces fagopyri]|uniref:MBL fold metallo-hydrolase n=1 Tax=Streptomyces fagopyri TaxID=2662397 RepID=A0A5Q0LKP9_9ACTN|nr:MBL fold metallo-hydrolase [Streptomyces fagopyri]QFZ77745.1 MBL fold metallo-hydrolase [Streptomyces fagopyri]
MDTRQHATGAAAAEGRRPVTVRLLGGPTALIEIGGLRLLTDPAFEPPGRAADGTRTAAGPRCSAADVEAMGPLHAVLLSHGRYADSLGAAGERLLATVPVTFTTTCTADRLGGTAVGLRPWYHLTLARPDGGCLKVTATAARDGGRQGRAGDERERGPGAGPVIGFVLTGPDVPTIYVSGDDAPSLDIASEVADRFGPVELALLGDARHVPSDPLPMPVALRAARAAEILGARTVIPVRPEAWEHCATAPGTQREAVARHGLLDRLLLLAPGTPATL